MLGPWRRRRGEARELRRDLTEQSDLRQDGVHAVVEHRRQRCAAIEVHPSRVLSRELDRRQRILDVVRHLTRHVGPGFESLRALEVGTLTLEVVGHLIEVFDQPAEFVGRAGRDTCVEIATRDPSGRTCQAVDRIGDSFGNPVAKACAKQHKQNGDREDSSIELVALPLALLTAERLRNRARSLADRQCEPARPREDTGGQPRFRR